MEATYRVAFKTLTNAVIHEWKRLLVAVLCFVLLGIGAGFFYAGRLSAPAAGSAEPLNCLAFDDLIYDKNFYTTRYRALNQQNEKNIAYLQALMSEKTLLSEQKEDLSALLLSAQEFKSTTLPRINQFMSQPNHLFVPKEFYEDLLLEYQNALANTGKNLVVSGQAVELLETMQSPSDLSRDNIADAYAEILRNADNHAANLNNKATYEAYVDLLTNHTAQVTQDTRKLADMQEKALEEVNALTVQLNDTVQAICETNHLNTSVAIDANNVATVTVTHTHAESEPQDNFAIILIFCTLVGICVGFFYAVCREAKREAAMCAATGECKPVETATGIEQDSKK